MKIKMIKTGKTKLAALSLLMLAPWVGADVTSTYYYSINTSGDLHVGETSGEPAHLKTSYDDASRFASGSTYRTQETSGFGQSIPGDWLGGSKSRGVVDIDSENAILKGRLTAYASSVNGGTPTAHASLDMGVRQYYRAEGSSPMTLRLSFHYDGSWDDGEEYGNYARVALGTYLTRVKDEKTYFAGGVEAERPLDIMLFTDFPPGPNFYDAYFGAKQEVADTLAHNIYFSNNPKYTPSGSLDTDYSFDVMVNPGELILVDTMFSARVEASRSNGSPVPTEVSVDFLNTAYSSIEVVGGGGSLVPQAMPITIPEPASLVLLGIGALIVRAVRLR